MLVPWHDLKLRICCQAANQRAPTSTVLDRTRHHSASLHISRPYLRALVSTAEFLLEPVNRGYVASGVVKHSHKHALMIADLGHCCATAVSRTPYVRPLTCGSA